MSAQSASEIDAANPFSDLPAIRGPDATPESARPRGPTPRHVPRPRFGDYSRTRFESRVAFGGPEEGEGTEQIATPTRRFSLLEITSGLPDDSREADERAAERRLRDLRGRVKAVRALVATTPGLAETLQRDWQRAAWFYARFGITESQFIHGIPAAEAVLDGDPNEWVGEPRAEDAIIRQRESGQLVRPDDTRRRRE
ncbi:MAG: hypothetical protein WB788_07060 [Thermoplasmata archaeon]